MKTISKTVYVLFLAMMLSSTCIVGCARNIAFSKYLAYPEVQTFKSTMSRDDAMEAIRQLFSKLAPSLTINHLGFFYRKDYRCKFDYSGVRDSIYYYRYYPIRFNVRFKDVGMVKVIDGPGPSRYILELYRKGPTKITHKVGGITPSGKNIFGVKVGGKYKSRDFTFTINPIKYTFANPEGRHKFFAALLILCPNLSELSMKKIDDTWEFNEELKVVQ